MLLYLHRDSSVRVFLMQKFADSSNNFLSWLIISVVFTLLMATLISQSIPIVPKQITDIHFFGYELNKFGYTLISLIIFYSLKSMLSYIFYAGTGNMKRWTLFQFTASKFYFTVSFVLMALCIYQYFYDITDLQLFDYYFVGLLGVFVFKVLFYLLSPNQILPDKWYYKFLYICTLQFAPVLVLWRVLYL
ncbi:DUF4271 domain-containing protein [Kaistella flava (ex Peng et al. 2021)]|uniref:DUF4271 domain-containing protein n=2 Tax=Kaistella flava (ex Peng et al. 2021) TaxID=2038776 RepID=A0A7M2YDS3_9FLAO|nr:DUF4271 domain-containing protein [Kaistella flava (ex Peng et al. 2021)]